MRRLLKSAQFRHWVACGLPILFIGTAVLSIFLQIRQADRDHALILALKRHDGERAIRLLNEGANANAQDRPWKPMTLRSIVSDALYRLQGKKPVKDAQTYSSAITLWYARNSYLDGHNSENVPLMQAFIAHRADVNAKDSEQSSVLHLATWSEQVQTVRLLLEHHADPNILYSDSGLTPLFFATPPIAALLIAHGADVNIRDSSGQTPLWNNAVVGDSTARLLVAHGADVNARDKYGGTPLMSAAYSSDIELTQFLCSHGARINARDEGGQTALMMSIKGSYDVVKAVKEIRWLLQHGAKVDDKDHSGRAVLHCTDDLYTSDKVWLLQILKAQLRKERSAQRRGHYQPTKSTGARRTEAGL